MHNIKKEILGTEWISAEIHSDPLKEEACFFFEAGYIWTKLPSQSGTMHVASMLQTISRYMYVHYEYI